MNKISTAEKHQGWHTNQKHISLKPQTTKYPFFNAVQHFTIDGCNYRVPRLQKEQQLTAQFTFCEYNHFQSQFALQGSMQQSATSLLYCNQFLVSTLTFGQHSFLIHRFPSSIQYTFIIAGTVVMQFIPAHAYKFLWNTRCWASLNTLPN